MSERERIAELEKMVTQLQTRISYQFVLTAIVTLALLVIILGAPLT